MERALMARAAAVFVLVCVCWPHDARAQTVFVQGAVGTDIRRFSAAEGEAVFDGRASTLALAAGGFVTPRWTVGLELDLGASTTEVRSVTVPIGGVPATISTTFELERRSVSALAGFHTPEAHRVRLGVLAGLSFSTVRREIGSEAPGVTPPPEPSILTDRMASPIVGVDVAVAIVPNVALVGSLRAQGLGLVSDLTGFSIRPAGGLRLVF